MTIVYEQDSYGSDYAFAEACSLDGGIYFRYAHVFMPTDDCLCNKISVMAYLHDPTGSGTVNLRLTNVDGNGLPDMNSVLAMDTEDPYGWTDDLEWHEFTFNDVQLTAATYYAVVLGTSNISVVDDTNWVLWKGNSSNPDNFAIAAWQECEGDAWQFSESGDDLTLRVEGDVVPDGASVYPTDAVTRVQGLVHNYERGKGYRLQVFLGGLANMTGIGLLQGDMAKTRRDLQQEALLRQPPYQHPYDYVDTGFYKGPDYPAYTDPGFHPMKPGETYDEWAERIQTPPPAGPQPMSTRKKSVYDPTSQEAKIKRLLERNPWEGLGGL